MNTIVNELASFLDREEIMIKEIEQEKHDNYEDILPLVYDFEAASRSRLWMRDVLLKHCQNDEDSDDNITEDEYRHMLRTHKMKQIAKYKVGSDPSTAGFKYYSSDVITFENKWPNHFKNFKVKKRKTRPSKEVEKFKQEDDINDLNDLLIDLQQENSKQSTEEFSGEGGIVTEKASGKKRKVDVDVLRKRIWRFIAKKEIPKAYRQKCQFKATNYLASRKFCKEVNRKGRCNALASQKFCKDTVSRARRLTREMQMFWKRYSKVEKVHRKKAEKHAQEQKKLDENIREAKRQQRKLNFLISQTELFAHFLGKKLNKVEDENSNYEQKKEQILNALTDDFVESTMAIESLGGNNDLNYAKSEAEAIKEEALKTVEEALKLHQNTQLDFENSTSPSGLFHSSGTSESDSLPQPAMFNGQLKSYQLKGMSWLVNLYQQGISGILADEMGLGKTVQTIAFLAYLSESIGIWGPFLVIAPASTLNNWHQEFCNFLPGFKVLPYWGNPNDRKVLRKFWSQASSDSTKEDAPFHVLVTSYQLVISDVRCFQRVKWQMMVLDEAQALKSSTSARWKTLLDFKCRNRLLLTGTPIQNTMAELWALLHFIMPSLFDSHAEFNEWFSKDIESHIENKSSIDQRQLSRLHLILKPFMLRRIKKDVENELSEKIEVRVNCSMMLRQSQLYKALQKNIKLEDLLQNSKSSATVSGNTTLLNLVMQFRKMCNHPDLFEKRNVNSPIRNINLEYSAPVLLYHEGFIHMNNPTKSKLLYVDLNIHNSKNIHDLKATSCDSLLGFLDFYSCTYSHYLSAIKDSLLGQFLFLHREFKQMKDYIGCYLNGLFPTGNYRHLGLQDLRCYLAESIITFGKNSYISNMCFTGQLKNVYAVDVGHDSKMVQIIEIPQIYSSIYSPKVISDINIYCNDRHAATFFKDFLGGSGRFLSDTLLLLYGVQHHKTLVSQYPDHANVRTKWRKHCSQPNKTFVNFVTSHGLSAVKADWFKINIPSKDYLISDSGKMYALDILLKRLKNENHRVLIYSQMTKMIDLLEEYMLYRNHTYIRLDGSSRINDRRDMVADFQNRDDIFVFLLSTRAGGLGINLTAADTVIFYDSDWNPTVDQQAMDRTHRLGQTKQVTVYRLVCQGTVDERILQRAEEKNIIQKMVISGGHFKQENLKTKEVVSLLLDDQQLLQNWSASKDEKQPYKGKKRGRKPNAEKDPEQIKRLKSSQKPSTSEIIDVVSTSSEPTPVPSPSSSTSFIGEEDALIIVDDNETSNSPSQSSVKSRKARGRPRIRPLQTDVGKRTRGASNLGRPRGSFAAGKRGRKPVRGRAAEMAGARAGAVAASAAAYAAYGYEYKDQQQ